MTWRLLEFFPKSLLLAFFLLVFTEHYRKFCLFYKSMETCTCQGNFKWEFLSLWLSTSYCLFLCSDLNFKIIGCGFSITFLKYRIFRNSVADMNLQTYPLVGPCSMLDFCRECSLLAMTLGPTHCHRAKLEQCLRNSPLFFFLLVSQEDSKLFFFLPY